MLAVVSVVGADKLALPLNVRAPLLVASPNWTLFESDNLFPSVRVEVLVLIKVPPRIVKVPVPSAALLPACTTPPLRSRPPLKVFAALRINVPSALFTKDPEPEMPPLNEPVERVKTVLFRFRVPAP